MFVMLCSRLQIVTYAQVMRSSVIVSRGILRASVDVFAWSFCRKAKVEQIFLTVSYRPFL